MINEFTLGISDGNACDLGHGTRSGALPDFVFAWHSRFRIWLANFTSLATP